MSAAAPTLEAPPLAADASAAGAAPPPAPVVDSAALVGAALAEASAAAAAAPCAEPEGEVLEIVDDNCRVIGRELRGEIHKRGLLHKAVYVWVFDPSGRLLLQQRSWDKKIGPGQWDLSAAEHLSPGESFHQAAERGLQEELGISARLPPAPVVPRHLRSISVQLPGGGQLLDCEFVESFRLEGYRGEVNVNGHEVIATRWATLEEVAAEMEKAPEAFTQWLREEMPLLPGA